MKKQRIIKTAICIDPCGSFMRTAEEEYEEIVKRFKSYLKPSKLSCYKALSVYSDHIKTGTELILFDYGGMGFGNSLGEDNSNRLVDYALANPSCLCIVVSSYTWNNYVKFILNDQGYTELPNLISERYDNPIPKWFLEEVPVSPAKVLGNICSRCFKKKKSLHDLLQCDGCDRYLCSSCYPTNIANDCIDCTKKGN
jgi:hypothetical protein